MGIVLALRFPRGGMGLVIGAGAPGIVEVHERLGSVLV